MKDQKYYNTIIIGAGISGLTAGKFLKNSYIILEKEEKCGGLSTQYMDGGHEFCYGGHYFHFKDKEIVWQNIKKVTKFNKYKKNSKGFMFDRFIPFPVQFHLSFFPKNLRDMILEEIIKKKNLKEVFNNMDEYLQNTFGSTLYQQFFKPFLSKYYGVSLKSMAHSMDKGSIPVPDRQEVLDGYNGKHFKSLGYNPEFFYPAKSLSSFIQNYSKDIQQNILTGEEVVRIDHKEKIVITNNSEYRYKHLINTMPLKSFLKMSVNIDIDTNNIDGLKNISTIVTNVVLSKRRKRFHWVYLPDMNYPFYRFGYYPGHQKIIGYLEMTVKSTDKSIVNPGIDSVYNMLKRIGVVENRNEIEFISNKYIPVSYILFDNNWKHIVPSTLKKLKDQNVFSIGRYGAWDYTSMSEDILNAMKIIEVIQNEN